MQLNNFEREFKEQINRQSFDLDLDQSWSALSERLDEENPGPIRRSRLSRWGLGIFVCLFLGYCVPGLWDHSRFIAGSDFTGDRAVVTAENLAADISISTALSEPNLIRQRNDNAIEAFHEKVGKKSINIEPSVVVDPISKESPIEDNQGIKVVSLDGSQSSQDLDVLMTPPNDDAKLGSAESNMAAYDRSHHSKDAFAVLPMPANELLHIYDISATALAGSIKVKKGGKIGTINSMRLSSGFSIPRGSYVSTNQELDKYLGYQNDHLKYLEAFSFSLSSNFRLGKGLDVGLGLQFQKVNQVLELSRLSRVQQTLEDVVVEIRINPYTQDSTYIRDDVKQEGTALQSVRHYNAMTRWSVPLKVEYLNRQNRWGFGLAIGTSFSFSHISKGRFIQTDGSITDVQVRHPANMHFLSLEPIITYALRHPFVLDFRPHFQQAINNGAEVHSVLHRPRLWGFDMGVRYEWK